MTKQKWFFGISGSDGPRYYRQDLPTLHLKERLDALGVEIVKGRDLSLAMDADVCFFSRCVGAEKLAAIIGLKQLGKAIVWDMDDDIFLPERFITQHGPDWINNEILNLHKCLDLADVITCSMPHLKTIIGREEKTIVLPNLIDLDWWPVQEQNTSYFYSGSRFMYAGTLSHSRDIALIKPLYLETKHNHPWVFFGIRPDWMADNAVHIPLSSITDYPAIIRLVKPSVLLAPLEPCRFNMSKSPIKVWESATVGATVVASDFGPYQGRGCAVVPEGEHFTWKHVEEAGKHSTNAVKDAIHNSWCNGMAQIPWVEFFEDLARNVRPECEGCCGSCDKETHCE